MSFAFRPCEEAKARVADLISRERISSPIRGYLPHSTTRYQAVFTDVSAVKASYVRLGIHARVDRDLAHQKVVTD